MDETAIAFELPHARAAATDGGRPLDRISVRDYTRQVEIGAFRTERGVTQRIRFNVVLEVAPPRRRPRTTTSTRWSPTTRSPRRSRRRSRPSGSTCWRRWPSGSRRGFSPTRGRCGSSCGSRSSTASRARSGSRSCAGGRPRARRGSGRAARRGRTGGRAWSTWGRRGRGDAGLARRAGARSAGRWWSASGRRAAAAGGDRGAATDRAAGDRAGGLGARRRRPALRRSRIADRARLGAEGRTDGGLGADAHGDGGARRGRCPTPAIRPASPRWLARRDRRGAVAAVAVPADIVALQEEELR